MQHKFAPPVWGEHRSLFTACAAILALGTVLSCGDAVTGASPTTACEATNGCTDEVGERVPVHKVAIIPWNDTIAVGERVQLNGVPQDQLGFPLEGREITWRSMRPQFVTVSSTGIATGIAEGVATIVATSEGKVGYAAVYVRGSAAPSVATVSVDPPTTTLGAGEATQLTATARDSEGRALAGHEFTWVSSDATVAEVNSSGRVTAIGAGSASITAETGGVSGTATITVSTSAPAVARVVVAPATASVETGNTVQLTARALDAEGNVISGRVFTWRSSETSVAEVNASGVVTGAAAGTSTIAAETGGSSGTSVVTVTDPEPVVARVTITPAMPSLEVGGTVQLTATARDGNGRVISGQTFTWSSSSTSIASVSSGGVVSGVGTGTTTVRATTSGVSGSTSVTVTRPAPIVSRVTISPANSTIEAGSTVQLTATARASNGDPIPGQTFTWSSSNTGVATVNSSGRVTGVAAGSATITARTSGVSGTTTVTVESSPPPSGAGLLFHSDWGTARGWSQQAYTDGGTWTFVSDDRGVPNKEVVDAAGLDMPTPNAWNAIATGPAQGWVQLRAEQLPMPAIGGSMYYRWYMRVMQPDRLGDNSTHPVEAGGSEPWAFEVENSPAYGLPPGTFTVWMYTGGGQSFNRTRWYLGGGDDPIALQKGRTYRFEYQVHRTGQSTWQQHVRIYDSAGTLLYDDDDFVNLDGVRMSEGGDLGLTGGTSGLGTWQVGNNGIGGSNPFPFTYAYYAAACIRTDTWCGPYRDGM